MLMLILIYIFKILFSSFLPIYIMQMISDIKDFYLLIL